MSRGSLRVVDMHVTGKGKAICRAELGERNVVLRIPLSAPAMDREAANWRALQHVGSARKDLATLIPAAVLSGTMQKVNYYVESCATGTNVFGLMQTQDGAVDAAAVRVCLRQLNPDGDTDPARPLVGDVYQREVGLPLETVGQCLDEPELVAAARTGFERALHGTAVRCGLTHGDFNPENMFAHNGAISGLIDWEHWCADGLPLLDGLNFVDGVLRLRDPELSIVESVQRLVRFDELPENLRTFVEDCYERSGSDRARHVAFVHLYWLQHVAKQLGELAFDPVGIQTRVRPLFVAMAERG